MGCGSSKSTDVTPAMGGGSSNSEDATPHTIGDAVDEKREEHKDEKLLERNRFERESLEAHNKYRVTHGAPPMILNRELCDIAQKWADHLAAEKKMYHSTHEQRTCSKGGTGENLAYRGSTAEVDMHGALAVDDWYSEIKDYDFERPGFTKGPAIGHFTQVVWDDSRELGIAFSLYKKGQFNSIMVVANYYPPGNWIGTYGDHVKPPK